MREFGKAIDDALNALRVDPENADTHFLLGESYFLNEDFQLAVKEYTEVIRRDPKYAKAFEGRGKAYLVLNYIKRGQADLLEYRRLTDPNA